MTMVAFLIGINFFFGPAEKNEPGAVRRFISRLASIIYRDHRPLQLLTTAAKPTIMVFKSDVLMRAKPLFRRLKLKARERDFTKTR